MHVGSRSNPEAPVSNELPPGARMPEITDDNLVEAQARIRALIVARYEKMWQHIEGHMGEAAAGERMLDPRMLEIGRGILKEEAAIYRLGRPAPVVEEPEDEQLAIVDRREIIAARLDELEAKRRAREEGQEPKTQAS